MNDDAALLRRYAEEKSEGAFAELVQRHLDLVYSAALRRLSGDAHGAADVAQQVFTTLARNAEKLSRHGVPTAWLYTATRNAAIDMIRSEQRRRTREQLAFTMQTSLAASPDPDWEKLRHRLQFQPLATRHHRAHYDHRTRDDHDASPRTLLPHRRHELASGNLGRGFPVDETLL